MNASTSIQYIGRGRDTHSHTLPAFSQNPEEFAPDFFSTQPPLDMHESDPLMDELNSSAGKSMGYDGGYMGGYNPQFDLEDQVDRVSELLEKDVDFDGWLKDISESGDISV
jgi:neural Wiskott-Aldrich syndrome protein